MEGVAEVSPGNSALPLLFLPTIIMEDQNVWQPPQYDLSTPPSAKSTLHITPDTNYVGNFPRVAKW